MYKGFSIYDFCSLFIIIGLILPIFFHKTWKDKTNKIFLTSLFTCLVSILENFIFLELKYMQLTRTTIVIMAVVRLLYLISLLIIIITTYVYMLSTMGILYLIKSKEKSIYKTILYILTIIPSVFIIISIPNQWLFSITIEEGYKGNFGTNVIYIFLICVLFLGVSTAIVNKKYLTKIKLIDCLILYPINIVSIIHQMIYNDYSFILFVITMSFYVISTTSQRPEILINPTLNAKTSSSFYRDTESIYLTKQDAVHIYVKFINHSQIKKYIGEQSYIKFLQDVSKNINSIIETQKGAVNLYYLEDSEFCVVFDDSNNRYINLIASKISELFYNEYAFGEFKVYPEVRTVVANIPDDIDNYNYLTYFAKIFHHIVPDERTPIYFKNISKSKEFLIKKDIEVIVQKALDNDRFEVLYQPIYSVKNKKYDSAEALVRLNDDEYGEISPSNFIYIAETNGTIIKIGEIILRKVLGFISSPEFKQSNLKYIEVNLTLAQCMETGFVEQVKKLLEEYKVKPEQLRFEITETMEGYSVEKILANMKKLKDLGVVFALDDYGIGYSNIIEVLDLPVDVVKLDKSFVKGMNNAQMPIIINDTINMLKNLGKQVLVEGVETEEALRYFEDLKCHIDREDKLVSGCDYIQGYYFSKPLPCTDFIEFLNKA